MLTWTAQRLADPALSQEDINALLESFTIHTRALLYFFYPPHETRDDDVLAQDFMPVARRWNTLAGAKPAALAKVPKRVGTEVAHISYGRLTLTPEAGQWEVTEIADALLGLVKTFAENADHLDLVWPQKTESSVLDVSKLSHSATNEFISSGSTPPAQAPTSVNTPSVQTLIIDTSGDFPPNDAD